MSKATNKHKNARSNKIPQVPATNKKQNNVKDKKNVEETIVVTVPISKNNPNQKASNIKEEMTVGLVKVHSPHVGMDSRVFMTNKAIDAMPIHEKAQKAGRILYRAEESAAGTTSSEQYNNLLLEQYGFNPCSQSGVVTHLADYGSFKPIEKAMMVAITDPKGVTKEDNSQCVNVTNDTGTDMPCHFSTADSSGNRPFAISPKDIEISNTPRLKVMAEKFTRFKKDHIELRKLDERIICVEYDVYLKQDLDKKPIQVMRAYFCVKPNCKGCQDSGIFKTMPSPMDEANAADLEKEVEMIEENLPENKPYLKDLRILLKKRQAISAKKNKSTLDLMSMYNMARNEMPPRDHDWSNTNLLSKAELQEVKNLIIKRCESRMYNLSRKRVKTQDMEKSDIFCSELFSDFNRNNDFTIF